MIPSYDEFISPLLLELGKREAGAKAQEVVEALADALGMSEADRRELLPSQAQPVLNNRVGWAHDRLKRAGLSSSPKRGFWMLTQRGRDEAARYPRGLPDDVVESIARVQPGHRLRAAVGNVDSAVTVGTEAPIARLSPDDRIEAALSELGESVAEELLALIADETPQFFEQLVLDLLHALGYGTSRADLQRVGRTGDGGIDGIISLDRLGLEKVYVQAKRWQGNVGPQDVQAFFGALAGRRAKKGVFITTSGFTRAAREFAESVSDSLVLVDGERLTGLMIEHGVGVSHRTIRVPHVDHDYFEDG